MNRFLLLAFFLLAFLTGIPARAEQTNQQRIDSLTQLLKITTDQPERCMLLNEISNHYYLFDAEKGIRYGRQALKLAEKIHFPEGQAFAYLYLAKNTSMTGDYDRSLAYCSIAANRFEALKDDKSLGLVYLHRGTIYGNQGKFPDALNAFLKALTLFEKFEDDESRIYQANAYQDIGNVFNFMDEDQKALKNYEKACALFEQFPGKRDHYAMNKAMIGTVYEKQKQFRRAISLYSFAERELSKTGDSVSLAFIQNWKGKAYLGLKKYGLSITHSLKALPAAQKSGDQELVASTYQNLGVSYLEQARLTKSNADFTQASAYLHKALAIHLRTRNHEELTNDYRFIAGYFSSVKNFEAGYNMQQLAALYKDSVYNFKNKQSIQNLEDQRTIALRDKQIELNETRLNSQEKERWFYGIGSLFLLIIVVLFYVQNRQRKRVNVQLVELNADLQHANSVKLRFLGILNHDLRSPVSKLIQFLHLQKEDPEIMDEATKERLEQKTIRSAENLLESMEDLLLWTKGQMEHFQPTFKRTTVESVFGDLLKHFYSHGTTFTYENAGNLELITDEHVLKTILRNLTMNALKATEKSDQPLISWKAWNEGNTGYLAITDNGAGATEGQFNKLLEEPGTLGIQSGMGLLLVRDLSKMINCSIRVDSKLGAGTTITLIFEK